MLNERILILNFGSQWTQLIARRVRENSVYCEVMDFHTASYLIRDFAPCGVILSGGPSTATLNHTPRIPEVVFELGVPILGICYGHQLLCMQLGGEVSTHLPREFGRAEIEITRASPLFDHIVEKGERLSVWMSHGDCVSRLPEGFYSVGESKDLPYAAVVDAERQYYGLQFHPEVVHTSQGSKIIANFLRQVVKCRGYWDMTSFQEDIQTRIRERVGDKRVICAVSGGVDSTVTAFLLHQAIGSQLCCLFIDTGLLRLQEVEQIISLFRTRSTIPLMVYDGREKFLSRLMNISVPEQKRHIIGNTFIEIFESQARQLGDVHFLAQGTIYPDVIESAGGSDGMTCTIKSHHNVGGLPECMNLELIEPLRMLFKDEVRKIGYKLGIPNTFLQRHPFPGPGLAIRIIGEVTEAKLDILRKADAILLDEIRSAGLYDEIWQAFAILLPIQTVGVMGDNRSYEYALALRAVTSEDGMTVEVYPFETTFLVKVATRIINHVTGINRVIYDVTTKPPATIEWE